VLYLNELTIGNNTKMGIKLKTKKAIVIIFDFWGLIIIGFVFRIVVYLLFLM